MKLQMDSLVEPPKVVGHPKDAEFRNQQTQLSGTQFDKTTGRYQYWEKLVPSLYVSNSIFNRTRQKRSGATFV